MTITRCKSILPATHKAHFTEQKLSGTPHPLCIMHRYYSSQAKDKTSKCLTGSLKLIDVDPQQRWHVLLRYFHSSLFVDLACSLITFRWIVPNTEKIFIYDHYSAKKTALIYYRKKTPVHLYTQVWIFMHKQVHIFITPCHELQVWIFIYLLCAMC